MKKLSFIFSIILLACLFSSCGKGDDTSFECTIDGKSYTTSGLLAYGVKDDTNIIFYGVNGSGSSQQSILIWVPADAKKGDVITDKSKFRLDFTDEKQTTYSTHLANNASGKITINSLSATNATGSFEATIYDLEKQTVSKKISGGTFDIKFR